MKHVIPYTSPKTAADQIIVDRFSRTYGVTTFPQYLALLHERTTAHLNTAQAKRVYRTTTNQRRRARLSFDDGILIIAIPMRCRRSKETLWAKTEFTTFLNIIEWGADGAWTMVYKGESRKAGQVRIRVPFGGRNGPTHATVARIITNALEGQQARVVDCNPLNLSHSNCGLVGHPSFGNEQSPLSKTDTRRQLQRGLEQRATAAAKKALGEDRRQLALPF